MRQFFKVVCWCFGAAAVLSVWFFTFMKVDMNMYETLAMMLVLSWASYGLGVAF